MVTVEEIVDINVLSSLALFKEWADKWKNGQPSSYVTKEEFLNEEAPLELKDVTAQSSGSDNIRVRDENFESLQEELGFEEGRNAIWYYPNVTMPWHTNSNHPGVRTYYVFAEGEGIFRWRHPETGEYHNSYDIPGKWVKRVFEVPNDGTLLWHAVWSGDWRLSIGFNTPTEQRPLEALS